MSYVTRVEGQINIEPALTWVEIKASQFRADGYDVRLDIEETTVDTDEGTLTIQRAAALIPTYDGPYRAYDLVEHVQAAIDEHPDRSFTGHLECTGEDGALSRVAIRDRTARRITPRIVWDEE